MSNAGQRYLAKIKKDINTGHPLLVPYHLKRSGKRLSAVKKALLKNAAVEEKKRINSIFGDAQTHEELNKKLKGRKLSEVESGIYHSGCEDPVMTLGYLEKIKEKLGYKDLKTAAEDVKTRLRKGRERENSKTKFLDEFFELVLNDATKFKTLEEKKAFRLLLVNFNSKGGDLINPFSIGSAPGLGQAYAEIPLKLRPHAVKMIAKQLEHDKSRFRDFTRDAGQGIKLSTESYVQNVAQSAKEWYEAKKGSIDRIKEFRDKEWIHSSGGVLNHTKKICNRINKIVESGIAEKIGTGEASELSDLLRQVRQIVSYSAEENILWGNDVKKFFRTINKSTNTDAMKKRPTTVRMINMYRNEIIENTRRLQEQSELSEREIMETNDMNKGKLLGRISRLKRGNVGLRETPPLLTWTPKRKKRKK